jgi:hypothetical protein
LVILPDVLGISVVMGGLSGSTGIGACGCGVGAELQLHKITKRENILKRNDFIIVGMFVMECV